MSLLSGQIGIPDGAYTLLNKSDIERAVSWVLQNQTTIEQTIIEGGGGGDSVTWAADGTLISASGVSSVSRESIGTYLATLSAARSSVDAVRPTATASLTSGSGGSGVNTIKAFSGYDIEDTDDGNSGGVAGLVQMYRNPLDGMLYVFGTATDDLYIHDEDGIGTVGAVTTDAGGIIQPDGTGGCLSKGGTYVWLSGASGVSSLRCYNTVTSEWTDFSTSGTGDFYPFAADDNAGTPLVYLEGPGGTVYRYSPDVGGASLGAADFSYTGGLDSVKQGSSPAVWDKNGYIWHIGSQSLFQISPTTGSWWATTLDTTPGSVTTPAIANPGAGTRLSYDEVNHRLFVCLQDSSYNKTWLYVVTWTDEVSSSAIFVLLAEWVGYNQSMHYDSGTSVLFISDYTNKEVRRYLVSGSNQFIYIDTVSVDDTAGPDNPEIDYDNDTPFSCFYKPNEGYLIVEKSTDKYVLNIHYQGADIDIGGDEQVVLIDSALCPVYERVSTSQVRVRLVRLRDPQILADGECTLHIASE